MSQLRVLNDAEISECCSMTAAIDAMQLAFRALSDGTAHVPIRTHLSVSDQLESLIMPVAMDSLRYFGMKAVSLTADNDLRHLPRIHAAILLFDSQTGQPKGLMNGEYITALRTGAASGLATQLLANPSAKHLVVFGCGQQASFQIEAVQSVLELERVSVVGRNRDATKDFCRKTADRLDLEIDACLESAVASSADVICTATSSCQPVFGADEIPNNCHVNAIGSYRADMAELPPESIASFSIYVDQIEACKKEAGEIVQALQQGYIQDSNLNELGTAIANRPQTLKNRTLFKSVGNAAQDLVVANLIMQQAESMDLGVTLNV